MVNEAVLKVLVLVPGEGGVVLVVYEAAGRWRLRKAEIANALEV